MVRLQPAREADYPAIVALTNKAFRQTGPDASWNVEGLIEGDRIDLTLLAENVARTPGSHLLIWQGEEADGGHLGHVLLEPGEGGAWRLGLLTVRPDRQDRKLGRSLLTACEEFARAQGATRIEMTVVDGRQTLIAWYERRGYARTGETRPWPYDDPRIGRPKQEICFVVLERELSR
jgi:predicted N-acetyltransferase YhbS